ncbi:MAG TPA: hypothetical protein VGV61_12910, partial [Thermoanaerobaculia bacterium]|nr:hypothetical protein [Thermoanaerobaculia bacterium]
MRPRFISVALLFTLAAGRPVAAQAPASAEEPTAEAPHVKVGVEVKAGYRNSQDKRFPVPFNFGPIGGPTSGVFLRTVDPGSSIEVPDATLYLDAVWGDALLGHVKVDMIDLYDRNPTST